MENQQNILHTFMHEYLKAKEIIRISSIDKKNPLFNFPCYSQTITLKRNHRNFKKLETCCFFTVESTMHTAFISRGKHDALLNFLLIFPTKVHKVLRFSWVYVGTRLRYQRTSSFRHNFQILKIDQINIAGEGSYT